jgi:FixJ family two-component response regulator
MLLDCSAAHSWSAAFQTRLRTIACALPIIAIAVRPEVGTRRIARRIGARAFFSKPVDAGALLDALSWAMHTEGAGPPDG